MAEACERRDAVVSNTGVAKRHTWKETDLPKCLQCPAT